MSENNKGSVHNSGRKGSSEEVSADSLIDYNVSASSLTRRLFEADRKPAGTQTEDKTVSENKNDTAKRSHTDSGGQNSLKHRSGAAEKTSNSRVSEENLKNKNAPRLSLNAPSHRETHESAESSHSGHSADNISKKNFQKSKASMRKEQAARAAKPSNHKNMNAENTANGSKKASKHSRRKHVSEMKPLERFLWGFKWIVRVTLVIFFGIIFACVGAGLGLYIGIIRHAPSLEMISIEPDAYTSFVYDKDGAQIDEFHGEENRVYVTLDQIPMNLRNAFIAIEDERFYSHNGIDFRGIARAAYQTLSGNDIQGASTITQQLIKNNVTKVVRNDIETKIQEQYLAVKYESMLTDELGSKEAAKDYILELYLNTINLNHGYNGVQVAAKGYYNKDVSELDLAECAVIAGITNNPMWYSPRTNPENNKKRQTEILQKMLEQGYITQEEHDAALAEDVYSYVSSSTNNNDDGQATIHTYFVDSLFDQVSQDLQDKYKISVAQANYIIYNGGLQIYSTFDKRIQGILDETFANDSLFPNVRYNLRATYTVSVEDSSTGKQEHSEFNQYVRDQASADEFVANKKAEIQNSLSPTESIVAERTNFTTEPQSAMVIEDYHTGHIPALIGGRGPKTVNRGFNRATGSTRQPGSVFKVLSTYAPGIDMGVLTAATPIEDSPFTVANYSPSNWWGENYKGMSNVRKGIQESQNVVTVKAMDMIGVDNCYDYLLNFGFTTLEEDNHLSTALGGITHGVTQLEVTAAYGTIGNGGVYKKPTLYTKVLDHDGNALLDYEEDFEDRKVLSPGASYVLIDMMKDVLKYPGTGTAAAFKNSNMAVCGKTGTTQNSKDLTFVGLTPYYAAGIWLGYDDYDSTVKNMEGMGISSQHEVVWRECMEKVHEGLEVKDFEKPDDVVEVNVCSYSGLKPNSGCQSHSEYFVRGTEPTENCKGHYAKLYLDDKYITSGYGYSSLPQGSDYSESSDDDEEEDEDETSAAADSPSVGYGEEYTPSNDAIQEAYEAEFGGLDNSAPADSAPADSQPQEAAPAADSPPPDSGAAPAE